MNIKLTEQDIQKIFDLALAAIKSGHNTALPSELQATGFVLQAFADFVQSKGMCLEIEQPRPREWQSIDD